MEQKQQQQEQLKIPQMIQSHKREALMRKMISTVTGMSELSISKVVLWVVVFGAFIVLKFVPNVPYGACIGVNIGVCIFFSIIHKLLQGMEWSIVHQILMSGLFGYLWSHQLCYSQYPQLIVLTLISIGTSIGPIIMQPVPQFTSPTLYIKQFSVHSVLYVRLLLPLPLFVIELIIDYGGYLPEFTQHMRFIRLTVSLLFLLWTFGWISTLYNSFFFLFNNLNKFLFGDQTKSSFTAAFACLVLNCVPIAIYLRWADHEHPPVWILWIGATITSLISFLFSYSLNIRFRKTGSVSRSIGMILTQCLISGGLVALLLCVDFSSLKSSVNIIAIIDLGIYLFFVLIKFISVPRNWLGLSIHINFLNSHYMRAVQRIMLRISAGFLVIILVQNLNVFQLWTKLDQTLYIDVDIKFTQYFFMPFLIYRSYKRSLSQSTSFSFHLSVLICLGLVYNSQQLEAILAVLFFPPFPHNFFMTLITPFTTPKKLRHKNEFFYQIVYLCFTVAAIIVHVLFLGMLEFTMFFGLPFFLPVIPTINQVNPVKSKQHSLYQKIIQYIPSQMLTFQKQGFYLLRISKYIILVQIKQQWYGFGQVIDIKGLEVQQVTSCHSKQGQTIDKLVEQTWGDNTDCLNTNHLWTVLSALNKCVIHVPTQNEIQLTGIIESKQFIQVFKEATLKALVWEISRITYSEKQTAQGEQIISDFAPICKRDKFQSFFPFNFAKQVNLQAQYPQLMTTGNINKKKLPPIKNKKQMVNDFMDLLESSPTINANLKAQTSTHYLNSGKKDQPKQVQDQLPNQKSEKLLLQNTNKINLKQLNASLIMTLYHYSVGKFDYFNSKKIYDLINMEKAQLSQVKFESSQKILSRSLSKAFKIAVDKITMGQNQIEISDFQDYQKSSFLGTAGSEDFNTAVANDLQDIWTLNYSKGSLSVKRLAKSQNDLFMFQADTCIIKSIWNNLRFQLMYAANDNDQRYSIQTHSSLMRNLWTEACQEPFGYPSYQSGNLMNS